MAGFHKVNVRFCWNYIKRCVTTYSLIFECMENGNYAQTFDFFWAPKRRLFWGILDKVHCCYGAGKSKISEVFSLKYDTNEIYEYELLTFVLLQSILYIQQFFFVRIISFVSVLEWFYGALKNLQISRNYISLYRKGTHNRAAQFILVIYVDEGPSRW